MHPTARVLILAVATAGLLVACGGEPGSSADSATTPAAASSAAGGGGTAPDAGGAGSKGGAADAYYATLVARHGQDISECPPADAPTAAGCSDGNAGGAAAVPRRVLLMLDASGSMAARQGDSTKLAIAQDAVLGFASRLDRDTQVALRVYGHRGGNREQDKPVSCRATELVQPFAPADAPAFEAAVRSFKPSGFTPIAASLRAAADDFAKGGASGSGNVVYLVSDGIETCDGDPAAAAEALRTADIGVVVNVIGFDVDAAAERQLREVAAAGGGDYLAARDGDALVDIFNTRLAESVARFNCGVGAAAGAFNSTAGRQAARFSCLVGKATGEFNAIANAASADVGSGKATPAQRDHAIAQAAAKRDAIIEPARAARDAAVSEAGRSRDSAMDAARGERDAALDEAEARRIR